MIFFTLLFNTVNAFAVKKGDNHQSEHKSNLVIENSNFYRNKAHLLACANDGSTTGSNCYIYSSDVSLQNSNFEFTNTGSDENYISFAGDTTITDSSVTISSITSSLLRFTGSKKVTITNLLVKNVIASANTYGLMSFESSDVSINNLNFEGTIKSTLFQGSISSSFELTNTTINKLNNDASTLYSIIDLTLLSSSTSTTLFTFQNNSFTENKAPVFYTYQRLQINVVISECYFYKNEYISGSCVYMKDMLSNSNTQYKMKFSNNIFSSNINTGTGTVGGALFISTQETLFENINSFLNNEVTHTGTPSDTQYGGFGGSIYLVQNTLEKYTLSGCNFNTDYSSQYGGSIFVYGKDETSGSSLYPVVITDCTFQNCKADLYGGALCSGVTSSSGDTTGNNDIEIGFSSFTLCRASNGGALYFHSGSTEGDEVADVYNSFFDGNIGSYGSSIYSKTFDFSLTNSQFYNHIRYGSKQDEAIIYVSMEFKNKNSIVSNCSFVNNLQGLTYYSKDSNEQSDTSTITFNNCTFDKNNMVYGTEVRGFIDFSYIDSVSVQVTGSNFINNIGQCIRATNNLCTSTISNCVFTNNTGILGCAIYVSTSVSTANVLTINSCQFNDNFVYTSDSGRASGIVYISTEFVQFTGINIFIGNNAIYEGTGSGNPTKDNCAYGGSLFIEHDSKKISTISNLIIRDSYATHYGGGVGVYEDDVVGIDDDIYLLLENCTFENCSSGIFGGAFTCGYVNDGVALKATDVQFRFCYFTKCKSNEGGAVYILDGSAIGGEETYLYNCVFDNCLCPTGSAIYCCSYRFGVYDTVFKNCPKETSEAKQSIVYLNLNEAGAQPILQNCTFEKNNQIFELYSQLSDGSTISNTITFNSCTFINNNPDTAGTSPVIDLQYINSGTVTFNECIFRENSGYCIFQDFGIKCNTVVNSCSFIKNTGALSAAIYMIMGTTDKMMTIENCTFDDNTASYTFNSRGIVTVFASNVLFKGINKFYNNKALQTGPIDDSAYVSYGGSLFIYNNIIDREYSISNLDIKNSYCNYFGGAIAVYATDVSGTHQIFVSFTNCTFENCSSGKNGGAIKVGTNTTGGGLTGDNDVKLSHCKFINCKSLEGGALYFQDGTESGDEETYIYNCVFDNCSGTTGSAIYCRSYKFEMYHSTIQNCLQEGVAHQSFFYVKLNEAGIKPIVENCTFYNNGKQLEFYSQLDDGTKESNEITFKKCNFVSNNQNSNGYDSIFDLKYIQSGLITFDSCIFEQNRGQVIRQDSSAFCDTNLNNCSFLKNEGGYGCAICVMTVALNVMITIENCRFEDNIARGALGATRGVVIVFSSVTTFKGYNTFINNQFLYNGDSEPSGEDYGTIGGSLFLYNDIIDAEYSLSNLYFKDSYSSQYGGAVGVFSLDVSGTHQIFVSFTNCTFENCSSGKNGGAIKIGANSSIEGLGGDNDVKLSHCKFINCKSLEGGALYFQDGTESGDEETYIYNCVFDNCSGTTGSAIYCRSYKFEMYHSTIQNSLPLSTSPTIYHQSCLYVKLNEAGIKPLIENCTFYNNEQNIDFYSLLDDGTKDTNEIIFKNCQFNENNKVSNGFDSILELQYIQSGLITFDSCIFYNNGGQAVHQDTSSASNTLLKNCTFKQNHGGLGCAIYVASKTQGILLTIQDCLIIENTASAMMMARGVVYAVASAVEFKGVNIFRNNKAIYELDDGSSKPSGDYGSFGGSLFIGQVDQEEFTLSNIIVENSYSTNFAGAVGFFCLDSEIGNYQLYINIENCTFNNCTSGHEGGALMCGAINFVGQKVGDNDVKLSHCNFIKCNSLEGGALYFQDGTESGDEETYIYNCVFDNCSGTTGSAIYCRSYKFEMYHSTIQNSLPLSTSPTVYHQSCLYVKLNEAGIKPLIENCTFYNNEQNIEFYSQLDDGTYNDNTITFNNCKFVNNNQQSNGADSILELQYIQAEKVYIHNSIFNGNGGQCLKQESSTVCDTFVTNCEFTGNHGGGGCALYVVSYTSGSEIEIMTVENCIFRDNKCSSSWGPRGCVYITTASVVFKGTNQFINNEAIYESYDKSKSIKASPSPAEGANGGAIFIIQETEDPFVLSNIIFTNCYSSSYGGAVGIYCLDDAAIITKLYIDLVNCTFDNCSSTYGGGISCVIEGTVSIINSSFIRGAADYGGDIYCTDDTTDTPSSLTVKGSSFGLSSAKQSGGAIYCISGKIEIQGNNFTQTGSKSKGSVLYIEMESELLLTSNNLLINKESGISAYYVTSSSSDTKLTLTGGCFNSYRDENDTTVDFLTVDGSISIVFLEQPCFSNSKDQSIELIGTSADINNNYFNCDKCSDVLQPIPTSSSVIDISASTDDGGEGDGSGENNADSKNKKLTAGAISGIVIACIVVVAAIIIVVLFVIKRKISDANNKDARSEAISQEADEETFSFMNQNSQPYSESKPIWGGGTSDIGGEASQVDDPFMKDFEEQDV